MTLNQYTDINVDTLRSILVIVDSFRFVVRDWIEPHPNVSKEISGRVFVGVIFITVGFLIDPMENEYFINPPDP